MTKTEAIAELSVLHERLSNPKDCEDGCYSWEDGWYVEAIDMAIEALSEPKTGWIPVSERLPEDCDQVLVTYKWSKTDREVSVGEYWGNPSEICPEEEKGWGKDGDHVTAWMPMPEPYKGGDTE